MSYYKNNSVGNVQALFSKRIDTYSKGLTKPESKALKDITKGILGSGSTIVRRISQSLHEKISLDKVCERLYRNLKNERFSKILKDNLLAHNSSKATDETFFLVDGSDIIKPLSNKIEGLATVRDGNTGDLEKGFNLLNITSLTYNFELNTYSILPISSQLYSDNIEIDTSSNMLFDNIIDMTLYSNNKGTYVFDRGYDSRLLLMLLEENENNYIIRSNASKNLIIDGEEHKFKEVAKSIERKYDVISNGQLFKCGVKKVEIRENQYPVKNPTKFETYLVVASYGYNKGYFYFFCNFHNDNLSDLEIITKAIRGYTFRWKIEEFHREVKQDFDWEKIQLMSYTGLKNLNSILMIAIDIVYSSIVYYDELAVNFPEFGKKEKKKKLQKMKFIYYHLSNIIKHIFYSYKFKKKRVVKENYGNQLQLLIQFE